MKKMNDAQFEGLVKLMRGKLSSPANLAARRVLVDDISQADAMRETNVARGTVCNAVKRYNDAHKLMTELYSGKNE